MLKQCTATLCCCMFYPGLWPGGHCRDIHSQSCRWTLASSQAVHWCEGVSNRSALCVSSERNNMISACNVSKAWQSRKDKVMKGPLWNFDSGFGWFRVWSQIQVWVSTVHGLALRPSIMIYNDHWWSILDAAYVHVQIVCHVFFCMEIVLQMYQTGGELGRALDRFLREAGGRAQGPFQFFCLSLLLLLERSIQICSQKGNVI